MGGLNFDEKDFQLAFGYELSKSKIDYMREISLEVFYKDTMKIKRNEYKYLILIL